MPFSHLGLSEALLKAVADSGYTTPTPIQSKAIPAILTGQDLLAAAETGTGKTAGFALPILQRLAQTDYGRNRPVRALILTPTRELAAQVGESVQKYGAYQQPRLKSEVVFGGVKINPQMMRLRGGVDILTATPGRLLDLVSQNALKLDKVEILVLDEADRMLDMGFIKDISKILALLPKKRQNLLFSATFSADIRKLTNGLLVNPVKIEVAVENAAADTIDQIVYQVNKTDKTALLAHLVTSKNWRQVLVFTSTKHGANKLAEKLNTADIKAAAIHGNKSQGARTSALAGFKAGDIRVLVATDVAARGIDIAKLPHVVNFELPRSCADYVHRIGRTGRAGQNGQAVSLVSQDEYQALKLVEKLIGTQIPRAQIDGFKTTA
ncbi:DEAD/DEAH box helicase [Methylovulum psychrotolerans]|jgi:ATP-dependent RNA helicase RhlE|uniref:DEAD-box ATP-dependent RNA helicase RhpA n=1 Tax=Methylovulum psychrotolerans TaxID=1704499 RepID=A0A1Z4C0P2_9GAMM|nr:DEAD/DEAH box helicase [Methylovulum psychrotolerans]ASF47096.1 ATP-dependent RNA helicase RhlE [Methylovulum psychrotolerans]MBT9100386.1 DEAD/DEAH box helicase [Methylovulum psychrotolerans]POZ51418.1 ATP-dependent RNA helicase RhlE [Methylovulum psychrotolerans]